MPEHALELFDTHCHTHEMVRKTTPVYDKWYSDGVERTPESVITAAHEAGVTRMLNIGTTLADSEQAIAFAKDREGQWASIGIHPHEAANHQSAEAKDAFKALLKDGPRKNKIIAIGECGLDYFYTHSPKEAQLELLKFQIELALEHELPLSFHVREAFDDFWPIFESYRGANIRGVLHSFTDTVENMEMAAKYGLYFGVNGIATFAKNEENRVIYRTIPQHLLLLETDAPFLTPIPFRGKVCESKHVRVTAEYLAGLREQTLEDIAVTTTANARALFSI
jgi:TatD DNase family protein